VLCFVFVFTCCIEGKFSVDFGSGLSMQGKSSASLKESSLLGVSLSDHVKADFSSSTLKWKVATMPVHYCSFFWLKMH
jgi:hypothetical protein